jgi:hypothetical protein
MLLTNYQTTRRSVKTAPNFVQYTGSAMLCPHLQPPCSSSCQIPHCPQLSFGDYFLSYKIEIELLFSNRLWFFSSLLSSLMNSSYGVCEEGRNCLHLSSCLPNRLFTFPSILNPSLQIIYRLLEQETQTDCLDANSSLETVAEKFS